MPQQHTRDSLISFCMWEHGIETETHEHTVVMTVEEQAKHVGHLEGGHSKNLLLKDKKNRLYLVSALTTTHVDLKALAQRLGLGKGGLRMAPEDVLKAVLKVPLGCVTPFALVNESAKSVGFLLDRGFQSESRIYFHPLTNNATTCLTPAGLEKFLRAIGREPTYVDLQAAVVVGKEQLPDLVAFVPLETAGQEAAGAATAATESKVATVTVKGKPKTPAAKEKEGGVLNLTDVQSVIAYILEDTVTAVRAEVQSQFTVHALEEQNKDVLAGNVARGVRRRLTPELESLLMLFKNTTYTEGFVSGLGSEKLFK